MKKEEIRQKVKAKLEAEVNRLKQKAQHVPGGRSILLAALDRAYKETLPDWPEKYRYILTEEYKRAKGLL